MKTGKMFEYGDNIEKYIPYAYVCQTLAKYFVVDNPYSTLPFSAKRRLAQNRIEPERFNSFRSMVQKAQRWYLVTGFKYDGYVLPEDEEQKWAELARICKLVNGDNGTICGYTHRRW